MTNMSVPVRLTVFLAAMAATGCSGQQEAPPAAASAPPAATSAVTQATSSADAAPIPETPSPYDALPEGLRAVLNKPFTGDLDELVARRAIRVAVTFNRTHYFVDEGQERGLTYESLKRFESDLNADLKTGNLKVHVVIVPMSREQLYPALKDGKVDMVAAMVTVTPEREELVAFSEPTRVNVNQVVVTGPGAPAITTVDDLGGQDVFVRKGSIYAESLAALNTQLKARGKPPVVITTVPEVLEDDDVLEMVNAGLAPITVVDDYLAEFWSTIFTSRRCTRTSRCGRAAGWPSRFAKRIPSSGKPPTRGSASTGRATRFATSSNAGICKPARTRRTPRLMPSAASCWLSSTCSRSTGLSTTWTTC